MRHNIYKEKWFKNCWALKILFLSKRQFSWRWFGDKKQIDCMCFSVICTLIYNVMRHLSAQNVTIIVIIIVVVIIIFITVIWQRHS